MKKLGYSSPTGPSVIQLSEALGEIHSNLATASWTSNGVHSNIGIRHREGSKAGSKIRRPASAHMKPELALLQHANPSVGKLTSVERFGSSELRKKNHARYRSKFQFLITRTQSWRSIPEFWPGSSRASDPLPSACVSRQHVRRSRPL